MKIAGIVAEYNPFHNGHKYHIEETKKALSVTHTVAVMSGDFVMRGEPALKDKLSRAKAAVKSGVDLVLELPVSYCLSSAEYFSYGGVYILNALGCVDYLSFGSEAGEIAPLKAVADKLGNSEIPEKIKEEMKSGVPVFTAISRVVPGYEELISTPNNILAVNYLKALSKLKSAIVPFTLKRQGDGYNLEYLSGEFASAKAIRNMLMENKDVSALVPEASSEILRNCVFEEKFDSLVTYALRMADESFLRELPDVSEGLENAIKKAAFSHNSVKDIAEAAKSKRYAYTRIKRIIYNALLGITAGEREKTPEYIRVLALNDRGREILKEASKKAVLPIITNVTKKDFEKYPGIKADYLAASVYSAVSGENSFGLKPEII